MGPRMELEQLPLLLHPNLSKQFAYLTIFTTEVHALYMALDIIRHTRSKDYVVFSDSLFSLQAIQNCKVENSLILKILKDHNRLINSGKSVTFCWIPSHVGIRGNEDADTAAKAGLLSLIHI